jgi:hypothetical protein
MLEPVRRFQEEISDILYVVAADHVPVTSSRDPGGPVIGELRRGAMVAAFRPPENSRIPLKPRGWVDEHVMKRVV